MPIEPQELIVREHERYACRLEAMLRIESQGVVLSGAASDGPDTVAAEVVDCSAGGAGLQTSVFIPRGCRVRLYISPLEPAAAAAPGAPKAWALDAPVRVQRVGSMMTLFFTRDPVVDLASAQRCDLERFARWHRAMLARGVYLPPSQFEAFFVSLAHTEDDVDFVVRAHREAVREIA